MGLRFRLYGLERMRRERMIGESVIGFASLNLVEPSTHWVILEPRSNLSVSPGLLHMLHVKCPVTGIWGYEHLILQPKGEKAAAVSCLSHPHPPQT